ncbi:MAG: type II toxin-antitoxin system Phd/YefM family antitoxin [Caldilineaceae bacterium]
MKAGEAMMNPVPYTIPISDMRFQQSALLARVEESPVVLTKQGRAVAVLVDPNYWNQILEELEDMADALAVAQAKIAVLRGEEELLDWATVKQELKMGGQNGVQN